MKYGHFAKTKKTEQNVSYIVYIGRLTFCFVDVSRVMRNGEVGQSKAGCRCADGQGKSTTSECATMTSWLEGATTQKSR